ncbi:glycogen-binding subunit 76A [Anopheles aquasalis]|uniref:glycogen-binding subunit 76A n=1 Tax=Anopheles aquasalis TaxID=42839 RepID=UPI00215A1ADF|nr:glycogen-binding subunit 76A [Anopheles aquasalis]XP_050091060.1 glycogen-binding subunit 76A [Anopheles aquasalis]
MTTPGDPSATTAPDRPCGITALLPIGMSCRGRAEAFARSLQSRLRNLGSQGSTGDDEDTADGSGLTANEQQNHSDENTWLSAAANDEQSNTVVTSLQPLRIVAHEADSFFDFGLEPESPSSPIEECEYTRLIETASATPTGLPSGHASTVDADPITQQAPESGYVCSSPCSTPHGSAASSHSSSSDCQFYDPDSSDPEQQRSAGGCVYYDCAVPIPDCSSLAQATTSAVASSAGMSGVIPESASAAPKLEITSTTSAESISNPFASHTTIAHTANGHIATGYAASSTIDSDSCSESLPPSQSTESNISTFTGISSPSSNSTLQDVTMEPLDDGATQPEREADSSCPVGMDVPDCATRHAIGNGHAIMPRGTVINTDTEIGLMAYGLQYAADVAQQRKTMDNGTDQGDREHHLRPCAEIQIAEVEKILHDCTVSEKERVNDENDESRKPRERRATLSSGDEDEEETKPQRIRRCSSLKTGKTPPGTPGRKKIVRFADVLGLDLTDVRTFMDEVPKVPQSAYEDLTIAQATEQPMPEIISLGPKVDRVLVPLFQQPGALPCFLDRVREKQVNLENAAVTDPITLTITGTVRVRNLDFHKSVYVRYTLDNWRSYSDLQATYAENSCDGFSDKFTFTLHGNSVQVGQRIEMAIRFHCRGEQFWDSNYDTNYVFQCLPITQQIPMRPSVPLPPSIPAAHNPLSPDGAWCSSFY